MSIRKGTDSFCPPPDLAVEPFDGVVGPDPRLVLRREVHVGKCFLYPFRRPDDGPLWITRWKKQGHFPSFRFLIEENGETLQEQGGLLVPDADEMELQEG